MSDHDPRHDLVFTLLASAAHLTRRLDGALSTIKGVSFSEYQLLASLRAQPRSTATRVDLADAVGLTPSGVTRALKPLERLGFVETVKDARDARKSLARLTPGGDELVRDGDGVVDDTLAGLDGVPALSGSDHERFTAVLRALAHA